MTQLSSFNWFRMCLALKVSNSLSSLIDFTEIRPVLLVSTVSTLLKIRIYLIMPKPVWLMTVQEVHKEYNLIDQIWAKYKLLDSGECGNVDTPAFKAECSELSHLLAHMSNLCRYLNLPMPKELHKPPYFKH